MTNFMQGYRRTEPVTEELIAVLAALLRRNPEQRLGQILCNAMGWHSSTLFNTYDEKIVDGLLIYLDDNELVGARVDLALARAIELLDQFDRGTRLEDSEYPGSPFAANVTEFLQEHGKRP